VAAVGTGVSGLSVGQAVTFVGGAFSEYVVAKAALCWPVPEPSPEAVACTISGTVAGAALHAVANMQPGETVLVTAAAGGTGHFAVQLAKLAGCHVVATCGGEHKAARLRALGVDRVIDYLKEVGADSFFVAAAGFAVTQKVPTTGHQWLGMDGSKFSAQGSWAKAQWGEHATQSKYYQWHSC
jgi:NADPH:quinone reductase-like Zn-dependent oxidoreductase